MGSLIRKLGRMLLTVQFWGMFLTVVLVGVGSFLVGFHYSREQQPTRTPLVCEPISQPPHKRPPDPFEQSHDQDGLTETERDEFISKNIPSVIDVRIRSYSKKRGVQFRRGSAVVIDEIHALTAEHVTHGHLDCFIGLRRIIKGKLQAGCVRWENMSVLRENHEADVALLKIDDPTHLTRPMPIAKNWQPQVDELIWNFGVKTGWSRGRITTPKMGLTSHIKLRGLVEAKMLSQGGDSGGPVLNAEGELIGLVLRGFHKKQLEYFIPIDQALKAVKYRPVPR